MSVSIDKTALTAEIYIYNDDDGNMTLQQSGKTIELTVRQLNDLVECGKAVLDIAKFKSVGEL